MLAEPSPNVLDESEYELRALAETMGYLSILSVPMMNSGEPIGAINVTSTDIAAFSKKQVALLQTFADQAVIAIENTRLFEAEQASKRELQESLEYQTATSEVLAVISRSPNDVQPVFEAIAQSAARLCDAQFCHVARFDGQLIHFGAAYGFLPEGLESIRKYYPIQPGPSTGVSRAIESGKIVMIPDVSAEADYRGPSSRLAGWRSILAVPMLKDGSIFGAIAVTRAQTGNFPERQIELLKTFADQAVIAIGNARLFEAEQASKRELEESLEYQTATGEVLSVISRSPSQIQPVFDAIVASGKRLLGAHAAIVTRLIGAQLELAAFTPIGPEADEAGGMAMYCPSLAGDSELLKYLGRLERSCASPGAAQDLQRMNQGIDVRSILSTLKIPTLVLHRTGDIISVEHGRYLGRHIPGAKYVELTGNDHMPWVGDPNSIIGEVETFLTGTRREIQSESDRVLASILFTDIVGSTNRLVELGDRRWKDLLIQHHSLVRDQLTRHRGREIDTAGDGFLAAFDGPARALRCGRAIVDSVRRLGIHVRAGVHTGECEVIGEKLGGIAVHIGARIGALAAADEVLVSRTVSDLVAGSGLRFQERGTHSLKGVPGDWQLLAAT
jgi:GAF domain-containing protein/class 3 adenylate cyclase